MLVLDNNGATAIRSICDVLVPGSARVHPDVYIDALLARMPAEEREATLAAFSSLEQPATGGADGMAEHAYTPEFMLARALACEAFYSDFVAPGAPGPGAWEEIDFKPPLAARLNKDWSYLGVTG